MKVLDYVNAQPLAYLCILPIACVLYALVGICTLLPPFWPFLLVLVPLMLGVSYPLYRLYFGRKADDNDEDAFGA